MNNPNLENLSKDELIGYIEDLSKNWLAHDGLWFLGVEEKFDQQTAIEIDAYAWERFTVIEARRIMKRFAIAEGSGLEGLKKALGYRLYANLGKQSILEEGENYFIFAVNECRVQMARKRKGLPDFPCKPVGILEYTYFAKTIDDRIQTECVICPPDPTPDEYFCAWKFSL